MKNPDKVPLVNPQSVISPVTFHILTENGEYRAINALRHDSMGDYRDGPKEYDRFAEKLRK